MSCLAADRIAMRIQPRYDHKLSEMDTLAVFFVQEAEV